MATEEIKKNDEVTEEAENTSKEQKSKKKRADIP